MALVLWQQRCVWALCFVRVPCPSVSMYFSPEPCKLTGEHDPISLTLKAKWDKMSCSESHSLEVSSLGLDVKSSTYPRLPVRLQATSLLAAVRALSMLLKHFFWHQRLHDYHCPWDLFTSYKSFCTSPSWDRVGMHAKDPVADLWGKEGQMHKYPTWLTLQAAHYQCQSMGFHTEGFGKFHGREAPWS